ncbi:helix-turn-helix transcriptional regulator [Butyricimonas virosa]|jgi:hypothetical protein|uniref:helix-turn-helix transcriptional regulator n=1 Tax=Butyricimonas virosa TaxID=544645 RepID=UPI00307B84D2
MSKKTLREILKERSISQQVVADALGINITNIRRYDDLSKRSWDEIVTIAKVIGVDISELIGLNISIPTANETEPVTDPITKRVPLVNQYAYAGYLAGYKDQKYIDQLPIIPFDSEDDPNFRYMAFEMKGNSMDDGSRDSYIEGDKLFCQEIPSHMWDTSKLHTMNWNFVIVYQKGIIVRKIIDHDIQNRTIVAHPLNPFINDELINLVDVYQIFHVLEYLRKN